MSTVLTKENEWIFYRSLKSGNLQCIACPRHCQLSDNEIGWCGARINKDGRIIPRTYGLISSLAIDPIEKKPLYHFLPGTGILSIGSHGCNMGCIHCQNYSISMNRNISSLRKMMPEKLVQTALAKNIPSIASTYNEPMIAFEYVRDIAEIAHKHNLKMAVVDNGYITKRLAEKLGKLIDAANIDVKGFSSDFYKEICSSPSWKPVLKTCEIFHELGVHLEITNLVIPTKNDSIDMIKDMCEWIVNNLSPNVPLHFSRFHPDYKLRNLPFTPIETLEAAYSVAKDVGLNYVYLGNVRSRKGNDTYCHQCNHLLIQRSGFYTSIQDLADGKCNKCQTTIPGVFS
ncbi:MAG: AmmeMemoRadiSam system radical SAM enzyme [Candidatus Heimdallarchaeota archaeon]|nr:MAG: AmmeMemoRadiSam system radical SAM enzyme [Candidatus Heimdallarchaeota archaeon]